MVASIWADSLLEQQIMINEFVNDVVGEGFQTVALIPGDVPGFPCEVSNSELW